MGRLLRCALLLPLHSCMAAGVMAQPAAPPLPAVPPWLPPRVVEVSPAPFESNVDLALGEVTITFDRPMKTDGWSRPTALPECGLFPAGPKAGVEWDGLGISCSLPVTLQPDTTYALQVNHGGASWAHFADLGGRKALGFAWVFSTADLRSEDFPAHVTACDPAVWSEDVDYRLREITVTCSRPVSARGSSWSASVSESVFPGLPLEPAPATSEDGLTLTFPARLKPDEVHAFVVGRDGGRATHDSGGRPMLPFFCAFKTAPAGADYVEEPPPAEPEWQDHPFGSFVYHTAPGVEPPSAAEMEANEESVRLIDWFLGVDQPAPIDLYIWADVEDVHRVTGEEFSQGVVRSKREIHGIVGLAEKWEVAHVCTEALGEPPGLFRQGMSVYLGETRVSGLAPSELALRALPVAMRGHGLGGKEWVPLVELLDDAWWDDGGGPLGVAESGTLVGWLVEEYGREKVCQLYAALDAEASREENEATFAEIIGKPISEIEQEIIEDVTPLFDGPIVDGAYGAEYIAIRPTAEADAEVMEALATYPPMGNVVTDVEALGLDISDRLPHVYGTMDGNLWLKEHADSFPFRVYPDRIVVDQTYYGTDLRLICCLPHPDNPRLGVTIYTAQRAEDVVGIHGLHQGPTDFVVGRGSDLIRSGFFEKDGAHWTAELPDRSEEPPGFGPRPPTDMAADIGTISVDGMHAFYLRSHAAEARDRRPPLLVLLDRDCVMFDALTFSTTRQGSAGIVVYINPGTGEGDGVEPGTAAAFRRQADPFHALVTECHARLGTDPARTYIWGGSATGGLAPAMAFDRPDLYAGVGESCGDLSIPQVHGKLDAAALVPVVLSDCNDRAWPSRPYTFGRWLAAWVGEQVAQAHPHSRWIFEESYDDMNARLLELGMNLDYWRKCEAER